MRSGAWCAAAAAVLLALPAPPARAAQAPPRSCLWRVTDGTGTVYILGSVHVLRTNDYPLAAAVESAYAASSSLVFEIDMDLADDPNTERLIRSRALLPDGEKLESRLKPRTFARAKKEAARLGLRLDDLERLRPWFFSLTLAMAKLESLGFHSRDGIEERFAKRARDDGKPVEGLESLEFQVDLLAGLADEDPNAFVDQTLDDLKVMEDEINGILRDWKRGDLAGLEAALLKSFRDYPEIHRRLVVQRNQTWAKQIAAFLAAPGTRLVIVGTFHLPGADGVLKRLEAQGLKVEQR